MVNKALFKQQGIAKRTPKHDTINEAGGLAYSFNDEHALAQYAVTGTFNNTYYAGAKEQLDQVTSRLGKVSPRFIAKLAVYAHETAKMKDVPAYLLAYLVAHGEVDLADKVFDRVCTNGKMLCNFVSIIRSGVLGRKSFGTAVKRMIKEWINDREPHRLWNTSIGISSPSIADVIKMVHPRETSREQAAVFKYLLGKEYNVTDLPTELQILEGFKSGEILTVPNVPFQVLSNIKLSTAQWKEVARNMPWNTLRMNLNQIARHGVFADEAFVKEIAKRLVCVEDIRRSRVFPYNLLVAFNNISSDIPMSIKVALQDAMETATENVPAMNGKTAVFVDVSGSMSMNVTGNRGSASTVARCVDIASLVASCILRKNPDSLILAFDYHVREANLNPRDSIMTNAKTLAKWGGGGTDCSAPFLHVNRSGWRGDNIIIVSDNESWSGYGGRGGTAIEWTKFKQRNPNARLVNLDIQPHMATQTKEASNEVMNIGGFSDSVFTVIADFFNRKSNINFVDTINQVVI